MHSHQKFCLAAILKTPSECARSGTETVNHVTDTRADLSALEKSAKSAQIVLDFDKRSLKFRNSSRKLLAVTFFSSIIYSWQMCTGPQMIPVRQNDPQNWIANDPKNRNDPQIVPQIIPGTEMVPSL